MSDYLCEELIVEIFTRLPPKSLIRFRSLSKSLCGCISSPSFIHMHTFRSPEKVRFRYDYCVKNKEVEIIYTLHGKDELPLCFRPQRGYIGLTKIVSFPWITNIRTIGLCNGTLCYETKNGFSLWNPLIRRKLNVPKCPQRSEYKDESTEFGYDPISDDYKIVWISSVIQRSFVYAVKKGSWCEIASPKPQFCEILCCSPFSFGGVLHWVVYLCYSKSHDMCPSSSHMLTFNLNIHVFGMIPLPGPISVWLPTNITTIQDSLALITYRRALDDTWIWVWKDGSWSVAFKLKTGDLPIDGVLQLQPSNNNGDLLLHTFGDPLRVYNPKTGVLSRVAKFSATSRLVAFDKYVETLYLLDIGETPSKRTQL